jgi:hypothetical protein
MTEEQKTLLSWILRTEFDVTASDELAQRIIELAAALELYELAAEMKKDLLIS